MGGAHALIDAVGVPHIELSENEEDPLGGSDFSDLELFFKTALTESNKTSEEWEKSHHKKAIDTKAHRGNVSRCLPTKGSFSYVHVDINGKGGFAHIVEDELKFGRNKAL